MKRRDFLNTGILVLGAPLTGLSPLLAQPKFRDDPFALGVASEATDHMGLPHKAIAINVE